MQPSINLQTTSWTIPDQSTQIFIVLIDQKNLSFISWTIIRGELLFFFFGGGGGGGGLIENLGCIQNLAGESLFIWCLSFLILVSFSW